MSYRLRATTLLSVPLILLPVAPALADQAPRLHTVDTFAIDAGSTICGDLVLSNASGSYTERVEAVLVGDVVHYNLVRTYQGLTFAGSDGNAYRGSASSHATFVLDANTGEPISGREVNHATFYGTSGSPGYLHEVLTIADGAETDVVTGPCTFGD